MKELAKNVKLFRKEQQFLDKEGKEVKYLQYYISILGIFTIPIKCVYPKDKQVLNKWYSVDTSTEYCEDCND